MMNIRDKSHQNIQSVRSDVIVIKIIFYFCLAHACQLLTKGLKMEKTAKIKSCS